MTITEFLEARIAEDEAVALEHDAMLARYFGATEAALHSKLDLEDPGHDNPSVIVIDSTRVLAECAARRAIIKQHAEWPVLVEREPSEMESIANGLDSITYRMTREVAWLTEREYVKRFGTEAPTAPMISTLAAIYSDHPDYRQEWASV